MNQRLRNWNLAHAALMLIGAATALVLNALEPLLVTAIASFVVMCVIGFAQVAHLKPVGGLANWLTLARLVLLLYIGFAATVMEPHLVLALAVIVVIADGLDGYLARRLNQQSDFGAVLDLEVDAFFGALFSILIYQQYDYGAWLLVPGLLRYGFVLLLVVLGWSRRPKVEMVEGKTIAVVFFLALLAPLVLDTLIAEWILGIASVAIVYSFAREFILLARRKEG